MHKLGLILIVFVASLQVSAQITACKGQDSFVTGLMESLDKSNALRLALERCEAGDGIHYSWMDGIKELGIKQVSFEFYFEWNNGLTKIVPVNISYLLNYYQYNCILIDREKIERLRTTGLENSLRLEAEKRGKYFALFLLKNKKSLAKGKLYLNLLDDERLPILTDLPEITYVDK